MDLKKAARDPWVWGQAGLIGLVVLGAPVLAERGLPWEPPPLSPLASRLAAGGVGVAGAVVTLWGFRSLGPNLTPGTEPLATGQLVERGAYAHMRHPIYTGISLLLAAWAGWVGTPLLMGLAGLLSFAYFDRKAAAEERWMTSRFPAYREYQARVGKFLPRSRPRPGYGDI